MKLITVSALVILSAVSFGQSIDDLKQLGGQLVSGIEARQEKNKISKASLAYNSEQPSVNLTGARVVIRPPKDTGWNDDPRKQNWLKSDINASITAIKGHPVWDDEEIDVESASRSHARQNKEVDQSTVPGQGKVHYRQYVLEYVFIDFQKSGNTAGAIGSWLNQLNFHVSRETAYFGIQITVRDGDTGDGIAVYKTLGAASTADNAGANLAQGFFNRGGVDIQLSGNSEEDRRFRAMENASSQMKGVIKLKCS